ncbi:uncharacterized protein LOC114294206 [Camellia sinensis]|uniref:uncharacterized protein LOC114294206 n=1 Tax=Camellia sinensis TaxID=4442 RepID=UPI0010365EDD|nr:uncharacterized protein LOC114294206 [Camellia sinensis]
MLGRKYTWCNAFDGNKWSRINRFLLSPEWLERYKLKLWGLPRIASDYYPIVLMKDDRDWGPKPFKFLNAWLLHLNLASLVEQTWRESQLSGSAVIENELHDLDLKAESRPLEEEELKLQRGKRNDMWMLSRKLEWEWLQKSRLDWNLKGDWNTRFFHVMASSRQTRNTINSITAGDVVLYEPNQVKHEALKEDVINFMKDFHVSGRLVLGLNSTFITLIPKPEKAITLSGRNILDGVLIANEVVDEALNILLQRARELSLLKEVIIGNNQVQLSHLQFADDSLLFCKAELPKVLSLKRILRCFEVALGLKINYHKSVVCGIGIPDSVLDEFASLLNCKTQSLPFKYLGLPLDANPRRKRFWKPVIDKFKLRLAGWKMRFLFFAGRSILVKAVLPSLPMFYLSLFKMNEEIAKELDKIQDAFLRGGLDLRRNIHLVKWIEVTKSIKQGGLGIRRIRDVNVCLLLKWWWRFASDHDSLWKTVICSKYNFQGGVWLPNLSSSSTFSKIWGGIIATVEQ